MQESPDLGSGQAAGKAAELSLQHNLSGQSLRVMRHSQVDQHAVVKQDESQVTAVVTGDKSMHLAAQSAVIAELCMLCFPSSILRE